MTPTDRNSPDLPTPADQAPWRQYKAWAEPGTSSQLRAERWVFTGMGLAFLVFGVVISALALPDAMRGRPIVWLVLVFPLVGLVMCWQAFGRWRQHHRYGSARLMLSPHPAPLGGRVSMHLDLAVPMTPDMRFDMALSQLTRSTSGTTDERRTHDSLQWETEGLATVTPTATGTRLQWQTQIPRDLPPSGPPDEDGSVWRVSVKGHGPAKGFSAYYDIPVFATEHSPDPATASDAPAAPWATPDGFGQPADQLLLRERIAAVCHVAHDLQGQLVLEQTYGRMRRAQLPWLFMGVITTTVGVFLWHKTSAPAFMALIFGGVGVLALVLSIWHLGNRRTSTLHRQQGVTFQRNFLGLPVRRGHWLHQDIARLSLHDSYGMQVNGQRPERIWQVRAHSKTGQHLVLADSISGKDAARLLMADIAAHTGWSVEAPAGAAPDATLTA